MNDQQSSPDTSSVVARSNVSLTDSNDRMDGTESITSVERAAAFAFSELNAVAFGCVLEKRGLVKRLKTVEEGSKCWDSLE